MPKIHEVKQGEYVSMIAAKYGFADYKVIWEDAANADLRKLRKTPNVLLPGDKLVIPDRQEKDESRSTEQRHRFVANLEKLMLRLVVKDENDDPVANTPYNLVLTFTNKKDKTTATGLIELEIDRTEKEGRLFIKEFEIPLKIGHLDPVESLSGQIGRLNNLGYRAGPTDELDAEAYFSAVEEFQCDHPPLVVDGVCGEKTQARLKEVHGS